MRDQMSRRRLKRMIERAQRETTVADDYTLDVANARCIEGGHWDTPHGIWPEGFEIVSRTVH